MKKILLPVMAAGLLASCSRAETDPANALHAQITAALTAETGAPNYSKDYYTYYLEPSVGRLSADASSNRFIWNDETFVMNLDVADIVNAKYYVNASQDHDPLNGTAAVARESGKYMNAAGELLDYDAAIYDLDEERYLVFVDAGIIQFSGMITRENAAEAAGVMMKIARGVEVNREAVLTDYAVKETISYDGRDVRLFENAVPENGLLAELFEGSIPSSNQGGYYEEQIPDTDTVEEGTEGSDYIDPDKPDEEGSEDGDEENKDEESGNIE
ncbi:MAG: hypothetical protein IKD69_14970 [Solobacterium sp.]|nr:hypothetical protein [Solobacterium sp.]